MFIETLKYSLQNLKGTLRDNVSTAFFFICFSVFVDLIRENIPAENVSTQFILGIVDILGSSLFYALFLNYLLGITKFSTLNFFVYFRVNILYSIFFFLGSLAFVLPGVWALTFLYFAPVMALEGRVHSKYFKESILLVKRAPWTVFGLSVILLLLMAFDFWFLGLLKAATVGEGLKYVLLVVSNLAVVVINIYLFITTVFLYRKLG